jgi:hypothetical protein
MSSANMQIIVALGKALYGDWWRNSVARELGVHPCTVGRWLSGIGAPSAEDVHRLMAVAKPRYMAILAAYKAGQQALRLPNPPP